MSIRDDVLKQWSWIKTAVSKNPPRQPVRVANLYTGMAGIALFLGYFGCVMNDNESAEFAHILATLLKDTCNPDDSAIGAFVGTGATIYLYAHLANVIKDENLLVDAESMVEKLMKRQFSGSYKDVVSGLAGLIFALESLYSVRPSSKIIAVVAAAADSLLDAATPQPTGIAWTFGQDQLIATGFAHGASGCAASLCSAYELTGNAKYLYAAEAAFEFERSLYVPEWSNWPNTGGSPDVSYPFINTSWCWGAAGLALARLRSKSHCQSNWIIEDARRALFATIAYGFSTKPQCLCHGQAGSIEALREAGRLLNEPLWTNIAQLKSAYLESAMVREGLCCEIIGHDVKNTCTLMTGSVGMGYALLRSLAADRVPCVLSLSPPQKRDSLP